MEIPACSAMSSIETSSKGRSEKSSSPSSMSCSRRLSTLSRVRTAIEARLPGEPGDVRAPRGHTASVFLGFIRIWLPAIVTLAGAIVMIAGGGDDISLEGGAGIIGAGLAIWLMNVLFRVGLDNDQDRDREDAARDFFDSHGHWPDEAPPARGGTPASRAEPTAGARTTAAGSTRPRTGPDRTRMRPRRPG